MEVAMNVAAVPPIGRGQIIRKGQLKYAFAATDSFMAEVLHGEIFEVGTELNIGGHLITSIEEKLTEKDVTLPFVNPATGPIRVKGAKPGDMIVVKVIDVGVIGVAPVAGGVITIDNGTHGGNLDVQEVCNGSLIALRAWHEGAYLYFGDVHALQGDGEVNGMGASQGADAREKPRRTAWRTF
jgi:acetamidase/formamidase